MNPNDVGDDETDDTGTDVLIEATSAGEVGATWGDGEDGDDLLSLPRNDGRDVAAASAIVPNAKPCVCCT